MEIRNEFSVEAPPETVYETLVDLERVGPTIPGATIGPAGEDGAHPAEIAVKLGPMRMTYRGTVRLVEQDAAERRAVLAADVRETRGQGTARARMAMTVTPQDGRAHVDSVTEVQMGGRVAQMGRGVIEDVAGRIVRDMASTLSAQLAAQETAAAAEPAPQPPAAAPPASRPVNGIALLWKVLVDRLARLFRRTN